MAPRRKPDPEDAVTLELTEEEQARRDLLEQKIRSLPIVVNARGARKLKTVAPDGTVTGERDTADLMVGLLKIEAISAEVQEGTPRVRLCALCGRPFQTNGRRHNSTACLSCNSIVSSLICNCGRPVKLARGSTGLSRLRAIVAGKGRRPRCMGCKEAHVATRRARAFCECGNAILQTTVREAERQGRRPLCKSCSVANLQKLQSKMTTEARCERQQAIANSYMTPEERSKRAQRLATRYQSMSDLERQAHHERLKVASAARARRFDVGGELLTVKELAERVGLTVAAIERRIRVGLVGEQLLQKRSGRAQSRDGSLVDEPTP